MKRISAGLAVVAAAAAVWCRADEKPTFRVNVDVVNILATVRDHAGGVVSDLEQDDFEIEEDGRPQQIQYFARQTDLPLTIGLLVDTSMSQQRLIQTERSAARQFFRQVLRPDDDMAFLIHFDVDVELLQDLTSSRSSLEQALDLLQTPERGARRRFQPDNWRDEFGGQFPGGGRLPGGIPWPGGGRGGPSGPSPRRPGGGPGRGPGMAGVGTTLYDSIFLAADEVLRDQAGRKTIVLISDGVDMGSKMTQEQAIEAAQRADAIVYSIRYYDSTGYGGRQGRRRGPAGRLPDGEHALEQISAETGGRLFDVGDNLTLDQVFARIQEELRNQYSIGYTPPAGNQAGYRKIRLTTKDKRLTVQTRAGYYPKGQ